MKYISLLSLFLLLGCAPTTVLVRKQEVPAFSKAKEAVVSVAAGAQLDKGVFALNGAYALTNHIAIKGGGMLQNSGKENNSATFGFYSDLAVGYYKEIKESPFVFETYLGYGYAGVKGIITHHNLLTDGNTTKTDYRIKYRNVFNQTSLTYKSPNGIFEAILSLQTTKRVYYDVYYTDMNMENIDDSSSYQDDFKRLRENREYYSYSPYFATRFRIDKLKLEPFISFENYFSKSKGLSTHPVLFGIGLSLPLPNN